jgi:putative spermidine/putrescine transport system permease protein
MRSGTRRVAWWASLPGLVFLLLPTLVVLPLSLSESPSMRLPPEAWSTRWYEAAFTSGDWMAALRRSTVAAVLTTAIAVPAGIAAALALRASARPLAAAIRMLLVAPAIIPAVLIGIGAFFLFARLGLNNTLPGLVLAHVALALPYVLLTIEAGLARVDPALEPAARSLGAAPWRAALTVTVPQIRHSIVVAALFAFLTSFDEISVAFFISSGDRSTLPRRMFSALRDSFDPTIAAISMVLIVVTALIVLVGLPGRGHAEDEDR